MSLLSAVSGGTRYTGNLYNLTPRRYQIMWILLSALIEAGWQITASGDGSAAYDSTGPTAITNNSITDTTNYDINDGGTYAKISNSCSNAKAWFVAKPPSGATYQASLCIQLTDGAGNSIGFRIKASIGGFSTGSPSATRVPAAAAGDEVVLFGGGTDASPTGGAVGVTDLGFRLNIAIDNASATPLLWLRTWNSASDTITFGITWVQASQLLASGDTNTNVIQAGTSTDATVTVGDTNVNSADYGWACRLGSSGTTKCSAGFFSLNGADLRAGTLGTNSVNSKEDLLPIGFFRFAAAGTYAGFKGVANRIYWNSAARSFGDHGNTSGTRDLVFVEKMALPWAVSGTACTR